MKIAIDIDDVLGELVSSIIPFARENYQIDSKFEDFTSYNFWEVWNISRDEAIKIFYDFQEKGFLEKLPTLPGSREALFELSKEHSLVLLTSRPVKLKDHTLSWTKSNFPELDLKILFSNDFFSQEGKTKGEICQDLNISMLVEDNINYALEAAEKGIYVFLIDRPWNKNREHPNITRVSSWEEITEKISQLDSKNT